MRKLIPSMLLGGPVGWTPVLTTGLFALLTGCGTPADPVSSSSQSSQVASSSSSVGAVISQTVWNSQVVSLEALSGGQWQQTSGPSVEWLNTFQFIAPDVTSPVDLAFNQTGGSGQADIAVEPCQTSETMMFEDCTSPGLGSWVSYESSDRQGQFFHQQGEGDFHVQWETVDSGDPEHGMVMEVRWNANDQNHQETARGWFGLAMPGLAATQGTNLQEYAQGALSFDMRVVYHEQPSNAAGFITKMECVYPCSSAEMPIPNGHTSFDWQTHVFPISQLTASGLDLTQVNHAFVIQPDWFDQEQNLTIQLDNIRLSKTYERPDPAQGCIGAGNVSYTLGRAANPSADQQEAYGLITAAMDVAVQNYNCYTNLSRHLTVEYNPGVATADGSTNGNIRFGSRASMHYVTAMHEIAHTFGAGGSTPFRAIVSDGVYHGPIANAMLRDISGNPADELHSDGTHFWPHGLNYVSEGGSQQDLINHCLIVEAIVADLANL